MFAAREGSSASARALIAAGAEVNQASFDGSTALMAATYFGHLSVVELLLQAGANVNAQTAYGFNALLFATQREQAGIAEVLIAAGGADSNE